MRCDVTRTRTPSGVSLTEVIARPSGKGNNGDVGITWLEQCFLDELEQIFEEISSPYYVGFTKKLEDPILHRL